jgi:hypothetical protein
VSTAATKWTPADFGAAMVDYVEHHAQRIKRRPDGGVECEAFYRDGDNPASLRIWADRGTWADARTSDGGGCKDFAERVAGMTLPDFMATHGSGTPRISQNRQSAPPTRETSTKLAPEAVAAFWASCARIADDTKVSRYLDTRRIPPTAVTNRDLARALPAGATCPSWAAFGGRSWAALGMRCILPMFDSSGRLASVHARAIVDNPEKKTLNPKDGTTAGLVFADALGRRLFAGDADAIAMVRQYGIYIAEGVPDFLTLATHWSDGDERAVIGIVAGSWCAELASQLPDGARVVVATDHDKAGEQYAANIVATLADRMRSKRIQVERWKP